jgi:hypothetical protein
MEAKTIKKGITANCNAYKEVSMKALCDENMRCLTVKDKNDTIVAILY